MSSPATVLSDLLRAFSSEGPGVVSLTATPSGAQIPDERFIMLVRPTWGLVDNILILPPAVPGRIVIIAGAATGGELRTQSPNAISINGTGAGQGAGAESAIPANTMVIAICESPTNWKGFTLAQAGTPAALQVAAP